MIGHFLIGLGAGIAAGVLAVLAGMGWLGVLLSAIVVANLTAAAAFLMAASRKPQAAAKTASPELSSR